MKVVFVSNFLNHHQKPLSDALAARCDYTFLAVSEMPPQRRAMGWEEPEPVYLCRYDREPERGERVLREADVIIAGFSAENLVRGCIRRGQPVFRYSERPLKNGPEPWKYLPRLLRWHRRSPVGKPVYLLCAGGYVAADYRKFGLFRGKALKWGYFPETRKYPALPEKEPGSILWAGRFLDCKHPEAALRVAAALKESGLEFRMTLIGDGPRMEAVRRILAAEKLSDRVALPGMLTPEQVRAAMEKAEIFLFTSDGADGWGAVLNEAMNSGCAVVAGSAAGATPYLVRSGENGMVYPSGDTEALTEAVRTLLTDRELARRLGKGAYRTITETWNGELAAQRLLETVERILRGEGLPQYEDGPCAGA